MKLIKEIRTSKIYDVRDYKIKGIIEFQMEDNEEILSDEGMEDEELEVEGEGDGDSDEQELGEDEDIQVGCFGK